MVLLVFSINRRFFSNGLAGGATVFDRSGRGSIGLMEMPESKSAVCGWGLKAEGSFGFEVVLFN
jgi:hypothetical protein